MQTDTKTTKARRRLTQQERLDRVAKGLFAVARRELRKKQNEIITERDAIASMQVELVERSNRVLELRIQIHRIEEELSKGA